MAWFRVDDGLAEHPKLEALEGEPLEHALAVAAWTLLGADCSKPTRASTGGLVTTARLQKVLPWTPKMVARAAAALVRCGLWHQVAGGYQFHDWDDYQPSAAEVEADRKAATERMRRYRHKQKLVRQLRDLGIPHNPHASLADLQALLLESGHASTVDVHVDGDVDASTVDTKPRDVDVTGASTGVTLRDSRAHDARSPAGARDPVPARLVPSQPDPAGEESAPAGAGSAEQAAATLLGGGSVSAHQLGLLWGMVRAETVPRALPWAGGNTGKAEGIAAQLTRDRTARADVVPTMQRLLREALAGRRDERVATKPDFGFGAWVSSWTEMREALHGRTAEVAKPAAPVRRPRLLRELT